VRDPGEIERAIAAFARSANGGLIVTGSVPAIIHRDLIVSLASRYRLPAVYFQQLIVGLVRTLVDMRRRHAQRHHFGSGEGSD
jgi:hypothetical protein